MTREIERIFKYKRTDILIKREGEGFRIGIGKLKGLIIWLEHGIYEDFNVAVKSGAEYGRICVDKAYVREKELKKAETK